MPTYEYACTACGHEFEEFQSIKADPIRTCPRCGKRKVERKIGIGGAVIFRGGGFYETDYRSADYEQAKKADAAPAAGAGTDAAASPTKEQGKAPSSEPGAKGGTKAESASKPSPATDGAAGGGSAASGGASGGSTASSSGASSERGTSTAGASGSRKNHAREGRGVGNVLQLGRAKASGAKPASNPGRASASKGTKRKGP